MPLNVPQDARYPGLAGQTAIVTGGASGIGAAIVRSLHAQGVNVGFIDLQEAAGAAFAAELNGAGGAGVHFAQADLTDIEAMAGAFDGIRAALGPAAILVNNAANDLREDFEAVTVENFDFMMNTNLRHVFFAAQRILPQMRELGGGSIVNMSSGTAFSGDLRVPGYATAKAAILGLTYSLARGLGPRDNIRVNAVVPGGVRTEKQMRLWKTEAEQAAIVGSQLIRRDLMPEDVAQTVLFLASDQSSMITRQVILINGGAR